MNDRDGCKVIGLAAQMNRFNDFLVCLMQRIASIKFPIKIGIFTNGCIFFALQIAVMNKIYHLSTCDTCRKIIASLPSTDNFELQDIKTRPITPEELDALAKLAGSYEALFSRKAMLYKSLGLKDQLLTEADFRKYLLEHYTFLSRPVFVIDGKIYIGNSKQNIQNVIAALS